MKEQLLTIRDLEKTYHIKTAGYPVLQKVNLPVNKGEFVAVMGPSGSGKTTLLNIISGFLSADSGEIRLKDRNLLTMDQNEMSDIRQTSLGFIFQDFMLIDGLTVRENIYLPQIIAGKENSRIDKTTENLLEKFGISAIGDKYPGEISGGQKQRAAISRALSNSPLLILADESTGALNTKTAKEIMELFTQINKEGIAILLVTHDPNIAARSERVLFLCDGEIVDECRFSKFTEKDLEKRVGEITKIMQKIGI